jgi:hypothetical protein
VSANANYTITYVTGTLTVTPAVLTITANNETRAYGAANPAFTAGYARFVNGDTAASLGGTLTFSTTATAGSAVGTYPVTPAGLTSSNYTITYVTGTLTVTPAVLTITANNETKAYGAANPALTVGYSGFVNGDTAASLTTPPTVTTTATAASAVGTYPIAASGAVSANYTIGYVSGTLTVTPAALTVTADNQTKPYGAANPVLTVSYSGFVNGDTAASLTAPATVATTATAASAVGTYPITASGAVSANYTIGYVSGTLTVIPAALTVTANNQTRPYGAANPVLTLSYSGFVNGDTAASLTAPATVATTATAASAVGTYPITASGAVSPNYTIGYVSGTLTVTPAALTVTADNQTKVYGTPNPPLTVRYSGFVNGDTAASLTTPPTISTTATTASAVGTYPITASGAVSANYTISYVNGSLTVVANNAPSFTKGADQTVVEDTSGQTVVAWATNISAGGGPGEEAQLLNFIVTNSNNLLFAVQPAITVNGTLSFTPAANANGSATVTVQLHDNGGTSGGGVDTSAPQTFTINVTAVNDAPSFTKGANQTVLEDAGAQAVAGWATSITAGPADEAGQALNFIVNSTNAALFAVPPALAANGTLTYTPAANANGSATVTVQLHDTGGTANGGVDTSASQTFTINVTAMNDVPSFTKGADQSVSQDGAAQTVAGWATAISAGPADESWQTLNFIVTNNNNALFSTQPAISATGTLTYTPAAGASGSATVTVQLHDNGGTLNGGVDTSASQTFTITITSQTSQTIISLTINDVNVSEGNTLCTPCTALPFTVSLSAASSQTVTVNYATLAGTAQAGKDYISASGTLTFAPGEVSKNVVIQVVGDTSRENNETLQVRLTNATNAIIARTDGIGTIIDDDSR